MRMALAVVFQLTNTFSHQATGFDSFINFNAERADKLPVCDPYGTQSLTNAISQLAIGAGTELTTPVNLVSRSAGPICAQGLNALTTALADGLAGEITAPDVLVLILSGAMTDQDYGSADLKLIESARASVGDNVPIVALFSQWANLSHEIVTAADLTLGADLDNAESVMRTAELLLYQAGQLASGSVRPASELRKLRVLSPIGSPAATDAISMARELASEFRREPRVIDAAVFPGFPFADVEHAGLSVLVTTNSDRESAANLAERLQRSIWDERESFGWSPANVEIAVHDAMLSESVPVTICDVGDDPKFGAAGDGTGLLWALIDLGAPNAALGVIVDPATVAHAIESGVVTELSIDIGGWADRRAGYPINITARVRRISDGRTERGERCATDYGRSVLLDVQGRHGGRIDVIVTERSPLDVDVNLFLSLGVDLSTKKIIGLKSTFGTTTGHVLSTSTPGITTPLLHYFDWERVPRPILPLDAV